MTEQQTLVRSSMNNLVEREKESNLFRQKMQNVLMTPMSAELRDRYAKMGIATPNGDLADAITAAMVLQALAGNIAAYTTIRDTMGYKPVEQTRNDVIVRIDMSSHARELGE